MKANGLEFPLKRSPGLNICCEGGVLWYTRFTLQYRTWLGRIEIFFQPGSCNIQVSCVRFPPLHPVSWRTEHRCFHLPWFESCVGCVAGAPLFARVDGPLLKANTESSLETLFTSTFFKQVLLDLSCVGAKKVKFEIRKKCQSKKVGPNTK